MKKILLAEDDADFASVLKQFLELYGYTVFWAKDGEEACQLFQNEVFSICILDVMMPKMDGFALAENMIQFNPDIPFIFLTAKKMKEDKIKGLKLGADDYIVKPFEVDELILRLNNIIKRSEKCLVLNSVSEEIKIGKYRFDSKRLELKSENGIQRVTEKEAALIVFFHKNSNQLLKREDVLKTIWGTDDYFSGRSMDVYISKLRKYFTEDPSISIESIRNIGLEFKIKKADL